MHKIPAPIIPQLQNADVLKALDYWVEYQPDALLYAFIDNRGQVIEQFNYREFSDAVDQLAARFQRQIKADRGARILLPCQPGLQSICALFACNKAGFIGVPTPPLSAHQLQAWVYSIRHILGDSQASGIAMCRETFGILDASLASCIDDSSREFHQRLASLDTLVTNHQGDSGPTLQPVQPHETFFIQYTSGSTSEPKGVEVTHGNLLANAVAVVDHHCPVAVSWLPQHHDMGLIGYYINILLAGGRTYGFSPATFIKHPALWFETITRYRATASSIPNFALELCLQDQRIPRQSLEQFDLSSLRFLMVAAEPVSPKSFTAFQDKFSPCGLPGNSMFAAYGLAEFTLAVSNYGRRSMLLDRSALEMGLVVAAETGGSDNTVQLMSCGTALAGTEIKIVNPESHLPAGIGKTGEVWLSGKSRAKGYWNDPDATRAVFNARIEAQDYQASEYLRTGDIGFMDKGELFICGRMKDTMIIHGRNIYPQDIEKAVQEATPMVRSNSVVAFVAHAGNAITVLAELVRIDAIPDSFKITGAVRDTLQIPVTRLVFLAPRSISRTSSGKVRRAKTRQLFEQGMLTVIADNRETFVDHPAPEESSGFDELEPLKQRYQLTGEEDFTLFDAGIDSLDLVMLLHWLKEALAEQGAGNLSKRINVRLFGLLTVRQIFMIGHLLKCTPGLAEEQLIAIISSALDARLIEERRQMQHDCIYLPESEFSTQIEASITEVPAKLLLTGGTGFLGPFLLLSLLEQSRARIYVLVRDKSQKQAEKRLRQIFEDTIGPAAPMEFFDARVTVLCGDLSLPHFALPNIIWQQLIENIDTIYHNGALVNYLLDYQHMRSTNANGTSHVIDLAISGKRKVLNHISTTFIFGWATKDVLYETDRNDGMEHLDFGYSQSKWVSEQLVFSAMAQGLDARIFRPALITPALDGRGGNLDITIRLLAFMVRHGVCVNTQNQVSLMPVDITANNIVAIATQAGTLNKTFHVTRDKLETMPQITELISQKTNITFAAYSLKDFVPEVIERCTEEDPLYLLLDFLVDSVGNIAAMEYKRYSNDCYRKARDQSPFGLKDAPLQRVVDGIISFLRQKNLLPSAPIR